MEKTTIGKVQLTIGIILLLLVIVGTISSLVVFKNMKDSLATSSLKGETDLETSTNVQLILSEMNIKTNLLITLVSTTIILFFLSLLFITQGKVNTLKDK